MSKVRYDDIIFDSELEVEYYKYLKNNNLEFIYHPKKPIKINSNNTYTPDFIVFYENKIEIVETKGFNQFSYMRDNIIHNYMKELNTDQLLEYLYSNDIQEQETIGKDILYKKYKYLKSFGWVDYDFKNPNTIANKRKAKINELEIEIKELKEYKKNVQRYFSYLSKSDKLNKQQKEWKLKFEKEVIYNDKEK